MESSERLVDLLEDINTGQKRLLEQQSESLQLQRQLLNLLQDRHESDELYDARARFQRRGNAMMDRTRSLFLLIIFLLVVLLFFVSWVLFG